MFVKKMSIPRRNIRYMNGKLRPGIRRLLTSSKKPANTRIFVSCAVSAKNMRFSHESWKLPRESEPDALKGEVWIPEVSMTDEIFGASLELLNKTRWGA